MKCDILKQQLLVHIQFRMFPKFNILLGMQDVVVEHVVGKLDSCADELPCFCRVLSRTAQPVLGDRNEMLHHFVKIEESLETGDFFVGYNNALGQEVDEFEFGKVEAQNFVEDRTKNGEGV